MIEFIYTIGGYGFSEKTYFQTLSESRIDIFCDVRQRRGVRGQTYSFLNSQRLQSRLEKLKIGYVHLKGFAPTNPIRQRQKDADKRLGIQKRTREKLGNDFIVDYQMDVLASQSPEHFFSHLPENTKRPCLFCVESTPDACHRSLISTWLSESHGVEVVHLRPESIS